MRTHYFCIQLWNTLFTKTREIFIEGFSDYLFYRDAGKIFCGLVGRNHQQSPVVLHILHLIDIDSHFYMMHNISCLLKGLLRSKLIGCIHNNPFHPGTIALFIKYVVGGGFCMEARSILLFQDQGEIHNLAVYFQFI